MNQSTTKTLLWLFAIATLITACKKHEEQTDTASPSYRIAQSEKLVLPVAVELPSGTPAGHTRIATFYAEGVQKYKAQPKAGTRPVVYEWVFVAPEAALFDASNKKAGTHGAGPHWQVSPADSIFAENFSPAKTAPGEDAESVDWLLLKRKTGTAPTGIFKDVDYVQRIATKGGKPPLTPPASLGETTEVKYRAVYRFSKVNP